MKASNRLYCGRCRYTEFLKTWLFFKENI
jgi:predicted nucleic-acid-binding Zn-ribbon protein